MTVKMKLTLYPTVIKKMKEKTIDEAMEKASSALKTRAKAIVPVKTGALRDSIETTKMNRYLYEVGPSMYYAVHVEYGTENMSAQPYLRPAMNYVKSIKLT